MSVNWKNRCVNNTFIGFTYRQIALTHIVAQQSNQMGRGDIPTSMMSPGDAKSPKQMAVSSAGGMDQTKQQPPVETFQMPPPFICQAGGGFRGFNLPPEMMQPGLRMPGKKFYSFATPKSERSQRRCDWGEYALCYDPEPYWYCSTSRIVCQRGLLKMTEAVIGL